LGQSVLFALCGELRTEKVLFYFSGVCKSAVARYPAGVIMRGTDGAMTTEQLGVLIFG
jgi:hypothetical protein